MPTRPRRVDPPHVAPNGPALAATETMESPTAAGTIPVPHAVLSASDRTGVAAHHTHWPRPASADHRRGAAGRPSASAPAVGASAGIVASVSAHPTPVPGTLGNVAYRQAAHAEARRAVTPVPAAAARTLRLERPSLADEVGTAAWRLALKRTLDVVGALVGLVLALPVLVVLAIAIRLESPGAVLFAQTRIGWRGRPFKCYKLRTMCADAESQLEMDEDLRAAYHANAFKVPAHADHRITALGRFLRTTSLDELPQFWNVLRGDMSLVGPRPIVSDELRHYGPAQGLLLSVRPGLTGAWAVGGRSRVGYPHRADLELSYARSWSIRGDLMIMLQTVGVVLQRRGAY